MKWPVKDKKFAFLLFAIIIVIGLEILSLIGMNLPMPYAPFIFAAFILMAGYEVLWEGLKAFFKLRFSSINLLMLLAAVGAFYLGEYPEAAVVIVLYVLGEELESIGINQSKSALNDLIDKAPKKALITESHELEYIDQIEIGTIISVKPGEMIPIDGHITKGFSTIDESTITGEPIPKDKHLGDEVYAGTFNKEGYLEIRTSKKSIDSTFSKIVQLSFEATVNKSPTQRFIQKFSTYYTPSILILAILMFIIPVSFMNGEVNHWLLQAISLLVIACPCALVISTPVAIYAAIGNASSKGILIKGGRYLEAIGKVKAIAFDKTRTLTYGQPKVSDLYPIGVNKEELLACTAGAEIFSEHPLAKALVNASRAEGFEPHVADAFESITGKGTKANCLVCKDETILVGKLSYIEEHETISEQTKQMVEALSNEGKTSIVVSFGHGVAGIIGLSDEIKPESKAVIEELKALGIYSIMLSGDHPNTVAYVAKSLDMDLAYGGLLPSDKVEKIQELLTQFTSVAMVGDGINDAPALAYSTVGVAMGAAGSDTAIETANIALINDHLQALPFLVRLSRKTLTQIKINTFGAIVVKAFFIALAFMGHANLVFAIAADVGVTLAVILISLRLMNYK